ncbi:hypothetical protein EVAR_55913_1 [Eumeta japonica]|uniref:Uncharacterized protein n=1 Tax=Eumeta variegata TaxID=151549 RepID=A0A4C1SEF1_EUMVA|nr:hypothetical protein EVAR_55913_1 [Eumeta japonica]
MEKTAVRVDASERLRVLRSESESWTGQTPCIDTENKWQWNRYCKQEEQNQELRLERFEIDHGTKIEIDCGTRIKIKSKIGIKISTEIKIEAGIVIKSRNAMEMKSETNWY